MLEAPPAPRGRPLTPWLARQPAWVLPLYAIAAAFSTYFCMYAFRKPFAAGAYEGLAVGNLSLKTAYVISQLIGYTASKYLGIKVCSEVRPGRRAVWLLGLVATAELALGLFYLAPGNWKIAAMFFNGLPLGMVWGMVVSYLEGRKTSELLLAGLSCSYIVASGAVKAVGRWLVLSHGVDETLMPLLTGGLFLLPFAASVWLLHQLPQPDALDVELRVEREPMNRQQRWGFFWHFAPGLTLLLTAYFFLTAYRDYRDNYQVEIIRELGYGEQASLLASTELLVAFGVLGSLASLSLIRDNRRGLLGVFAIMIGGMAMLGVGTLLLDAQRISGLTWMVLVGLGSYLCYVPYGAILFDRLIASTRVVGTVVFTIYLADALGYTGSIGVQLYKDLAHTDATRFEFFRLFTYFMSLLGAALLALSCAYFLRQQPAEEATVAK